MIEDSRFALCWGTGAVGAWAGLPCQAQHFSISAAIQTQGPLLRVIPQLSNIVALIYFFLHMILVFFGGQLELCRVYSVIWWQLALNGMLYLMYLMYLTTHAWCAVTWYSWVPLVRVQSACQTSGSQRACFGRQCPGGLATLLKGVPIMHLDKAGHCQNFVV